MIKTIATTIDSFPPRGGRWREAPDEGVVQCVLLPASDLLNHPLIRLAPRNKSGAQSTFSRKGRRKGANNDH
jgi:hypothetical protein